ncbi:MAG: LysR family transcriptional regulator [Caulobacterales bacterium]|nr:LysR family transcriptional regulator [Caulobacterales bacterium]
MELHQVRYFVTLARTLNFTRAAELCNVTQPALTKAVQKLEQEMGGALLHRERQLTQLTDLGRLILPMLERTLAAADSVRAHAADYQRKTIAPLRLALSPCVSAALVSPAIAEIARVMPGLQVEVFETAPDLMGDLLLAGHAHAAVAGDDTGMLPDRIDHWDLFEERILVCGADFLPAMSETPTPIGDLVEAAWLERIGCDLLRSFWRAHVGDGHDLRISHRGRSFPHLQHLCAAGLGLLLLPEHAPRLSSLTARPLEGDPLRRRVQLLVVAGRHYSPALDAFVKLARLRAWRESFARPDRPMIIDRNQPAGAAVI